MNRWLGILLVLLLTACGAESPPSQSNGLSLAALLGGDGADGFARAVAPREFVFPDDHAAHRNFRSEWWYFTGQLAGESGRRFGFQLTFFRFGSPPQTQANSDGDSRWRASEAWMAHFAISDPQAGEFRDFERFSRGALGLAGASEPPVGVWLDDWRAEQIGAHDWRIVARQDGIELALDLRAQKAPVAHGDSGLSAKGTQPGNASFYYSLPRLAAAGALQLGGERLNVSGTAWLDREWSTSALEAGVAGWDWLSLQLTDDRELMLYRLRRDDGSATPQSYAALIESDGRLRVLDFAAINWRATREWASPKGGRYPVESRLQIGALELDLRLSPLLDDQEIDGAVRYWEGAIEAHDASGRLAGRGYLELTGYSSR